jgi:hypothetical protein
MRNARGILPETALARQGGIERNQPESERDEMNGS